MELVKIKENEITVKLGWSDVLMLSHLCRHAMNRDALCEAEDWSTAAGFAEALIASLEAAGLAAWQATVDQEDATLAIFRTNLPLTKEQRALEADHIAAVRAKTHAWRVAHGFEASAAGGGEAA